MSYDPRIFGILLLAVLFIDLPMVAFVFKPKIWDKLVTDIQGSKGNDNKINTYIGFIFAYILIPLGLFLFAFPLVNKDNWIKSSLLLGFAWGFITYGVFDFTNLVLFKKYPISVAFGDAIWGGVMSSLALLTTYAIYINFIYEK